MGPEIYEIKKIGSGILAVMAKPVAGEWIDDEFSGIARSGINRIVSLLEPRESQELGLQSEGHFANRFGMEFVSYPIKDRGLPLSPEDYLRFTKNLQLGITDGVNTVIHCRAGIGRTGLIAAGVLLHCGIKPMEALELISKKRGVSVPDTQEQVDWVVKCSEIKLIKATPKYKFDKNC